jgi:hypothetical protein
MTDQITEPAPSDPAFSRPIRTIGGIGRVVLWTGGSLWIGRAAGLGRVHAHHAIQISLALTGVVRFRSDPGAWAEYASVIIHPDHPHQFDGAGQAVAQVFVEPETIQGRALLDRHAVSPVTSLLRDSVEPLAHTLRAAYAAMVPDDSLRATGQAVAARLSGAAEVRFAVDRRVLRVIDYVHTSGTCS